MLVATSSNHAGIIVVHEASREYIWLRSMTQDIQETCGLSFGNGTPTIV